MVHTKCLKSKTHNFAFLTLIGTYSIKIHLSEKWAYKAIKFTGVSSPTYYHNPPQLTNFFNKLTTTSAFIVNLVVAVDCIIFLSAFSLNVYDDYSGQTSLKFSYVTILANKSREIRYYARRHGQHLQNALDRHLSF